MMDSFDGKEVSLVTQHLSLPIKDQGKEEKLGLLFVCLDSHFSMSGYAIVIKKESWNVTSTLGLPSRGADRFFKRQSL